MVAKGGVTAEPGIVAPYLPLQKQERGYLAALLVFLVQLSYSSHTSRLSGLAPARGHRERTPPGFLVCVCQPIKSLLPSISQKAGLHSPEGNNLA